jgi:hypothetical protein
MVVPANEKGRARYERDTGLEISTCETYTF